MENTKKNPGKTKRSRLKQLRKQVESMRNKKEQIKSKITSEIGNAFDKTTQPSAAGAASQSPGQRHVESPMFLNLDMSYSAIPENNRRSNAVRTTVSPDEHEDENCENRDQLPLKEVQNLQSELSSVSTETQKYICGPSSQNNAKNGEGGKEILSNASASAKTTNLLDEHEDEVCDHIASLPLKEIPDLQREMTSKKPNAQDESFTSDEELITEKDEGHNNEDSITIDGNRIVNFSYIYEQFKDISQHNSAFGCNLNNLVLKKEIKKGFISKFIFTCNMCNAKFSLKNCPDPVNSKDLNINDNVVSSFMSIGSGFTGLENVSSSLNIPCMSDKLYAKCHSKVCELWELAKVKCMEDAAKEEYDLAVLNNEVDENGVPMITVVADACWAKRSYRKNYNSLSGCAVIIGYRTNKVLYMAVKNKYCMICARAENQRKPIPDHICFKNYKGSSSAMESTALVEGFKSSLDTHGLIYSKLIADGDSSTYKNIVSAKPYENVFVEKIECTNHLLRNYCTKLDELTRNTSYPIKYRKIVGKNILRLRRAVKGAVKHIGSQESKTFEEKVIEIKQDLLNAPLHVFGSHTSCKAYYCKHLSQADESIKENHVPEMKSRESAFIFSAIMKISTRLVNNAKSLMYNVSSNIAEIFNNVIAKFIGGKRINYSGRQSYAGRCAGSVLSFNSKQPQTYLARKVFLRSPNNLIKRLEMKQNIRRLKAAKRKIYKSFVKKTNDRIGSSSGDKHYGDSCEKPDMDEADFLFAKEEFMKKITLSEDDRNALERRTILQSDSAEWHKERGLRLTAFKFGSICKRGLIKCGPLVKSLLYGQNLNHVKAIRYGRENEPLAIKLLEEQLGSSVRKCGLFVDRELPFIGASPDGLIDDDKIVEIKCPYSAAGMTVDDAITQKKIDFWRKDKNGTITLNKNHDWFFQIQGQLHITRRKCCIFAVWTDKDMKIEYIQKDDDFWKYKMAEKLTKFYSDCMLPELVDSRIERNMEIRNPDYITAAIEKREAEKLKTAENARKRKLPAKKNKVNKKKKKIV